MLCLIIKLHNHSTIYFNILFVFIFYTSVFLYISIHCIVYCLYVFIMYCAIWSYYYYYYRLLRQKAAHKIQKTEYSDSMNMHTYSIKCNKIQAHRQPDTYVCCYLYV